MARTFVTSNDEAIKAEIYPDPADEEIIRVFCIAEQRDIFGHGFDAKEEAEEAAGVHVDRQCPERNPS
jgi:hypothetical protein